MLVWGHVSCCFGQQVIFFSKEMNGYCINKQPVLYKKIFLTLLKMSEKDVRFCDNLMIKRLSNSCNPNDESCEKILMIYKKSISKYKGTVFGN